MDVKLTLKLDAKAIEWAKEYANRQGVSLSGMVESFFLSLSGQDEAARPVPTGVVAELAGILAEKEIDISKEGRARHLASKHS
jgi:hypothetical protein